MKNKKYIAIFFVVCLILVLNCLVFNYVTFKHNNELTVKFNLEADKNDEYQFFYSGAEEFTIEKSITKPYSGAGVRKVMRYTIPEDIQKIRFDIGKQECMARISDVQISCYWKKIDITQLLLRDSNEVNTLNVSGNDNEVVLESLGEDGYIIVKLDGVDLKTLLEVKETINISFKIFVCITLNIVLLLMARLYKPISILLLELYNNRKLMWNLSKNDFKTKYAGSYLGIFWAFVQPVITVLIYWFVFQVGFRTPAVQDFPFILWLVAGLVPWFFFSDAISNATNTMIEYSYLVKKVVFKISILPIVKILSALFIHIFFVGFAIILFALYGYPPTAHVIQVIYYTVCMFVLALGISYITSSVIVFFKDLGQIVAIILQIGVWMTPIMWDYNIIAPRYQWILKINPMYYIVEGYRDTFINHVWFWERYNQTLYFWIITIVLFGVGSTVFKKLKIHFADVL